MACTCQICGRKYKVDLNIPDELWKRIKMPGINLLCGSCIMSRIEALGEYDALHVVSDSIYADLATAREALEEMREIGYELMYKAPETIHGTALAAWFYGKADDAIKALSQLKGNEQWIKNTTIKKK